MTRLGEILATRRSTAAHDDPSSNLRGRLGQAAHRRPDLLVAGAYLTLQPTASFPGWPAPSPALAGEREPARSRSIFPRWRRSRCASARSWFPAGHGGAARDYLVPSDRPARRRGVPPRRAAEDDVRFGRACQVGALASLAALAVAVLMRGWDIPAAITSGMRSKLACSRTSRPDGSGLADARSDERRR